MTRRSQQAGGTVVEGLRAIVSTTDALMRCHVLDEVSRCAVENARTLLGLDRCSVSAKVEGPVALMISVHLDG